MNENPFKSPLASNSVSIDNSRFSDRAVARRLLEARDQGYTVWLFLRWSWKQYLLLAGFFSTVLVFLAFTEQWMFLYLVAGTLCGCCLRDFAWLRAVIRKWPFTVAITDWAEVERLAQ